MASKNNKLIRRRRISLFLPTESCGVSNGGLLLKLAKGGVVSSCQPVSSLETLKRVDDANRC